MGAREPREMQLNRLIESWIGKSRNGHEGQSRSSGGDVAETQKRHRKYRPSPSLSPAATQSGIAFSPRRLILFLHHSTKSPSLLILVVSALPRLIEKAIDY